VSEEVSVFEKKRGVSFYILSQVHFLEVYN